MASLKDKITGDDKRKAAEKWVRDRAYPLANEYYKYYQEQVPQLNLKMDSGMIEEAAKQNGKEAKQKSWQYQVFKWFVSYTIISAVAIISIAITVFTGGSGLPIALTIIGAAISLVTMTIQQYQAYKGMKIAIQARNLAADVGVKRALNDAKQRGKKITSHLIKHPYEICANGSVYKQGAAGSDTYEPLTAADPTRGIYGLSLTDNNTELNTQLTNKSHISKAGNKGYFGAILDTDEFDVVVKGLDWTDSMKTSENRLMKLHEKLLEFVKKAQDNAKLHYAGDQFTNWVDDQSKKLRKFFVSRIVADDFLNKNQYYQNGEMLPLFEQLSMALRELKKTQMEFSPPTWKEEVEQLAFLIPPLIRQIENKVAALPAYTNIAEIKAFREKRISYKDFQEMEKKLKARTTTQKVTAVYPPNPNQWVLAYIIVGDNGAWTETHLTSAKVWVGDYAEVQSDETFKKIQNIYLPFDDEFYALEQEEQDLWNYVIVEALEKMGYEILDKENYPKPSDVEIFW